MRSGGIRRAAVGFTPTTAFVTVRAVVAEAPGGVIQVGFDDVVVVRGDDAELVNADFDDGPGLPGWSTFGETLNGQQRGTAMSLTKTPSQDAPECNSNPSQATPLAWNKRSTHTARTGQG